MIALEREAEWEKASESTAGRKRQHLLTSFNGEDWEASMALRPDPRRWGVGFGEEGDGEVPLLT